MRGKYTIVISVKRKKDFKRIGLAIEQLLKGEKVKFYRFDTVTKT